MRTLLLLVILFAGITRLSAQKSFKRTTLYTEILGSGLVLSVNYERQVSNKPGLGWYAGIGLGGDIPLIPLGAKYLFQLGNEKSFIETGAGIVLVEYDMIDGKNTYYDYSDKEKLGVAFVPCVGYRHHTRYGFMWRVNYTPMISAKMSALWLCGLSLGWRL